MYSIITSKVLHQLPVTRIAIKVMFRESGVSLPTDAERKFSVILRGVAHVC